MNFWSFVRKVVAKKGHQKLRATAVRRLIQVCAGTASRTICYTYSGLFVCLNKIKLNWIGFCDACYSMPWHAACWFCSYTICRSKLFGCIPVKVKVTAPCREHTSKALRYGTRSLGSHSFTCTPR